MRVAAIDPSLASSGLAYADGTLARCRTKTDDPGRLRKLYDAAHQLAKGADLVVIEDLPTHAMSAGLTGRAQGVVRMAINDAGAQLLAVPPATLKKAVTQSGNAKKPVMRAAMLELTGVDNASDDEVDGWGLRQIGLMLVGDPACVLPEDRRQWLAKLDLPEGVKA